MKLRVIRGDKWIGPAHTVSELLQTPFPGNWIRSVTSLIKKTLEYTSYMSSIT